MKTKTEILNNKDVKLIYQEPIPIVYCDGFQGIMFTNNIAKLNLTEDVSIPDEEPKMQKRVIAKLVMPVEGFFNFVEVLIKVRDEAKKQMAENKIGIMADDNSAA